ncbi:MAG: hypothetical protein LBS56_02245, partial [Propionibacteriaceae bacterium]|nr:hypothetical protein [Propionibacteriaceae bacterium]
MTDWKDIADAQAALDDPNLPAADLAAIVKAHKSLRAQAAVHPSAYPDLLDWLDRRNDPVISAAVAVARRTRPA